MKRPPKVLLHFVLWVVYAAIAMLANIIGLLMAFDENRPATDNLYPMGVSVLAVIAMMYERKLALAKIKEFSRGA